MVEIKISRRSRDFFLALDKDVQAEVASTFGRLSENPYLAPMRNSEHPKYGTVHLIRFTDTCELAYVVIELILKKILMPPEATPTHIIGVLYKPSLVEEILPLLE